nr:hypothetical protein [Tanacetum cinerariifolium]
PLPNGNFSGGFFAATCTAIQSEQPCYQRRRDLGVTCDFGGTGILTNVDPSYGSCIFTGSSNSRTSLLAFGPLGPTANISPPHRNPEIMCLMLLVCTSYAVNKGRSFENTLSGFGFVSLFSNLPLPFAPPPGYPTIDSSTALEARFEAFLALTGDISSIEESLSSSTGAEP